MAAQARLGAREVLDGGQIRAQCEVGAHRLADGLDVAVRKRGSRSLRGFRPEQRELPSAEPGRGRSGSEDPEGGQGLGLGHI